MTRLSTGIPRPPSRYDKDNLQPRWWVVSVQNDYGWYVNKYGPFAFSGEAVFAHYQAVTENETFDIVGVKNVDVWRADPPTEAEQATQAEKSKP